MRECNHCGSSFNDEEELADHLAKAHEWEEIGRIDRRRIEDHCPGKTPDAGRIDQVADAANGVPVARRVRRRHVLGLSAGTIAAGGIALAANRWIFTGSVDTEAFNGEWRRGPDLPWEAEYPAVAAYDGALYVFGGALDASDTIVTDSTYRFDPDTESWTELAPMPVEGQRTTASVVGDRIYIIDGRTQQNVHGDGTVRIYDPESDSWSLGTDRPVASRNPGQATDGERIYLFGGNVSGVNADFAHVYDPAADQWEELPSLPFPNRQMSCHYVPEQEKIYFLGGEAPDGPPQRTAVLTYDPETGLYDESPTDLPKPSQTIPSTVYDGHIILAGGEDEDGGSGIRTFRIYDPDTDTWGTLPELVYPTEATDAAVVDGSLYVPGGRTRISDESRRFDIMQVYEFDTTS